VSATQGGGSITLTDCGSGTRTVRSNDGGAWFEWYTSAESDETSTSKSMSLEPDKEVRIYSLGSDKYFEIKHDDSNAVLSTSSGNVSIDDAILFLTDPDVTQPGTNFFTSDTWGSFSITSGTSGGTSIWGLTDDAGTIPFSLVGFMGSADPTDAQPAIQFSGKKSNGGTGATVLGDAETVFKLLNHNIPIITAMGNGDINFRGANNNCTITVDDNNVCDAGTEMGQDNNISICIVCAAN
jgi:hypothetical protein